MSAPLRNMAVAKFALIRLVPITACVQMDTTFGKMGKLVQVRFFKHCLHKLYGIKVETCENIDESLFF